MVSVKIHYVRKRCIHVLLKLGRCVLTCWKQGICVAEMGGMYQLQKWGGLCRNGCGNVGYVSVAEMGVCVVEMGGMCCGNVGYVSVAEMGVCVVEMGGMCCGNVGYVAVAEMGSRRCRIRGYNYNLYMYVR